jgi:hypothetical protein
LSIHEQEDLATTEDDRWSPECRVDDFILRLQFLPKTSGDGTTLFTREQLYLPSTIVEQQ